MRCGLVQWGSCPSTTAKPKVGTEYLSHISTWALLEAIVQVFEANLNFANRFKKMDNGAQGRCDMALGLIIPRLEAMSQQLGSSMPVTAPKKGTKAGGIERLRDVARGLQKRVTLAKLIGYDAHIRPYLAALLVGSLSALGETLVVPDSLHI